MNTPRTPDKGEAAAAPPAPAALGAASALRALGRALSRAADDAELARLAAAAMVAATTDAEDQAVDRITRAWLSADRASSVCTAALQIVISDAVAAIQAGHAADRKADR